MSRHRSGPSDVPLPPRPAALGEPRPPAAPRFSAAGIIESGNRHVTEADRADPPRWLRPPPPGRSPVLEVHHGTWRDVLFQVVLYSALLVILVWACVARGRFDVGEMVVAAIIVAVAVVAVWSGRTTHLAAGADWVRSRGKTWVDTYALTQVKVTASVAKHHVHLTDDQGRRLVLSTHDLQANPRLWELVYNGIRHGIAAGAEVKGSTRRVLRPVPPENPDRPRAPLPDHRK